uniref:Uncharacterized protein n=1 Tax=Caenorhabditis japonica TaxID=281687 RepID=A0A8R1I4Y6_CAEJA
MIATRTTCAVSRTEDTFAILWKLCLLRRNSDRQQHDPPTRRPICSIWVAAGNDSSRALRALNAIDNARDWLSSLREGTRFQSFSNPLNDSTESIQNGLPSNTRPSNV